MAITNGYTTLALLRARIYDNATTAATTDDAMLEKIVEAVSREIDGWCMRRFYVNTNDETRYYTTRYWDCLYCPDDIVTITTLKTDDDADGIFGTTWATTDYIKFPLNATLAGLPFTHIKVSPNGRYTFPIYEGCIQIVGKFGFAAVPGVISEACLLQSARLALRRSAPFGVQGVNEFGQGVVISTLDPDVQQLIQPMRRAI